ncbi:hypothetical protein [Paenibacillus puerhi]|uniref:hypothetical protein n=1 Tax=Paenibacillus puerhi TaxID=2692622 RepID=UPI00135B7CB7|nr:hypothetical protein [Paenibacillus puerhi]
MWKKLSLVLMAATIAFSFSAPQHVDAKRGYSSPKKSYSPSSGSTTQKPNSGVNNSTPAASKTPAASTAAPAKKPGFFSGGLMKGLLIGGLAGMLFGGLFGGLGMLGNILGFLVNMLAIVVLVVVIRKIYIHFRDRKKLNQDPRGNDYR